jgi:hypothetical protein
MSEALRVAPTSRGADELPFAIDLELRIQDRDVIAALLQHAEGADRCEFANEALKIGVLALRRASTAFDGDFIRRETDRMLENLSQHLNGHAALSKERLEGSLKEYFHPESSLDSRLSRWRRLATRKNSYHAHW